MLPSYPYKNASVYGMIAAETVNERTRPAMTPAPLRDARLVARRALCLGALLERHDAELRIKTLSQYTTERSEHEAMLARRDTRNQRLLAWLAEETLTPYLTTTEAKLMASPLGTWSTRALSCVSWRAETLGVLLWTLRAIDTLPPMDTPFDVNEILRPLELYTPTIDFIWCARLRPLEELQTLRERMELWLWRTHATELELLGVRQSDGKPLREVIYSMARASLLKGAVPRLIEGDFPAFGKAYAALTSDQRDMVRTIVDERASATYWVCDANSAWVSLPLD